MGIEPHPRHDHRFNDDILIGEPYRAAVVEDFPGIIHLLDNPELRAVFARYDAEAKKAQEHVRKLGLLSVTFGVMALIIYAARPAWSDLSGRWIFMLLEIAGILAAGVSSGGLWAGPWKRRWLESRLMTERLRQWHFQLLVRRGHDVEASCVDARAIQAFKEKRRRWLREFLRMHEGHLDAKLETLTGDSAAADTWLHPESHYRCGSHVLAEVFRAYEPLRFDLEHGFAEYKLRKMEDKPLWLFHRWAPMKQAWLLSGMATTAFLAALLCSAFLVYAGADHLPAEAVSAVRSLTIVFALFSLALRGLREGLAPEQDIERYSDYRSQTSQLRTRFVETSDEKERLHLMREMEAAAVAEMRGFLRTHRRATFLLG